MHKINCKCPVCLSARGERKPKKIAISFKLSPETIAIIEDLAEKQGLSKTAVLEMAVKKL